MEVKDKMLRWKISQNFNVSEMAVSIGFFPTEERRIDMWKSGFDYTDIVMCDSEYFLLPFDTTFRISVNPKL